MCTVRRLRLESSSDSEVVSSEAFMEGEGDQGCGGDGGDGYGAESDVSYRGGRQSWWVGGWASLTGWCVVEAGTRAPWGR